MTYINQCIPVLIISLFFVTACNDLAPDVDIALTSEDRQAIEGMIDDWENYSLTGNWEGYAELFHEDAVRSFPGVQEDLEGRDQMLAAVRDTDPSFSEVNFSIDELSGNPELAYVRGYVNVEYEMDINDETIAIAEEGAWLGIVTQDEDGNWLFSRFIHQIDDRTELDV